MYIFASESSKQGVHIISAIKFRSFRIFTRYILGEFYGSFGKRPRDVDVQDCKQFDENNFHIRILIKEIISNVKEKTRAMTAASSIM